jgi:hypothetical protein
MFPNFCLLFTESFIESIEDEMVNLYFRDIESIENEYQTKIKEFRFKIFQAYSSSNKNLAENLKIQLEILEKEFYVYIAITMNQKRKQAMCEKVCTTLPILTFGNPYFKDYVFNSEAEDQSLISFLML